MLKQKGITPVIAIVLLLLVTVGAVGVVYTQFQSIVGGNQAENQLNENQRMQNADYDIIGVSSYKGGNCDSSYCMDVTVKNTGTEIFNLTSDTTLNIGTDGGQAVGVEVQTNSDCDWTTETLQQGNTASCKTGVEWPEPNDGQSTSVELTLQGNPKADYTCTVQDTPSGSSKSYC